MAKRTGSKGSRSGRRAGKERAERARQHGLPERQSAPLRARAATPEPLSPDSTEGTDRSSDAPPVPRSKSGAVPTWAWVAGVALALLAGAYFLSRQRDQAALERSEARPEPEVGATSSSAPPLPTESTLAPSATAVLSVDAPVTQPPSRGEPAEAPSAAAPRSVAPPPTAPLAPAAKSTVTVPQPSPPSAKRAVAPSPTPLPTAPAVVAPAPVPAPVAPAPAAPPASPSAPAGSP